MTKIFLKYHQRDKCIVVDQPIKLLQNAGFGYGRTAAALNQQSMIYY